MNIGRKITNKEEAKIKRMLYTVIQEKYQNLPAQERNAIFEKYTKESLLYETSKYPFTGGNVVDPGAFNAFTHAYTTAKMSRNPLNLPFTLVAAFAKEAASYVSDDFTAAWNNNIPLMNLQELDHNRDWRNNIYGIKKGFGKIFASDKDIARSIFDGMEKGELVENLKDSQKRVGLPYKFWSKNVYDLVEQREHEYYRNKKFNLGPGDGATDNYAFQLRVQAHSIGNIFSQAKSKVQNFFGKIKGFFDTSYGELGVEARGTSSVINDPTRIAYLGNSASSAYSKLYGVTDVGLDGFDLRPNYDDLPSEYRFELMAQYDQINTPKTFKETLTDKLGVAKDFLVDKGAGIAMGLSSFIGGVQGLIEIIKAPAKGVLGWIGKTLGIVNSGLSLVSAGFGMFSGAQVTYPQSHTGGKISGREEAYRILRGGETVRTEEEEREIKEQQHQELLKMIAPYLEDEDEEEENVPGRPLFWEQTEYDKDMIIHIIGRAWKYNLRGFRNVLRYE